MLRTVSEYLDAWRDGRRVYIGSELVQKVTTHWAFRNTARSFANLYDRTNNYHQVAEVVCKPLGAGPFQMPADSSVLSYPRLRETFETYWSVVSTSAVERFKFIRLAWDYFGSQLASRHSQYERFDAGPQFVNALYNFFNCPWNERRDPINATVADMTEPELKVSLGAAE